MIVVAYFISKYLTKVLSYSREHSPLLGGSITVWPGLQFY